MGRHGKLVTVAADGTYPCRSRVPVVSFRTCTGYCPAFAKCAIESHILPIGVEVITTLPGLMQTTQTEADFEQMSWHDCNIWRLDFMVGDPDEGDRTNDLVIGIDFIVEWLCGVDTATKFKIAPATLVFHGVTDPKIGIDWGRSGFRAAIHDVTIDQIVRELVRDQKVYPGRPYYHWRIPLNWPEGSEISLGAVGFTQTLLAEPLLCDAQRLSLKERNSLVGR